MYFQAAQAKPVTPQKSFEQSSYINLFMMKKCPVSACGEEFNKTDNKPLDHWKTCHLPYLTYYFCSECYFVDTQMDNLKEHLFNNHRYDGDALTKVLAGLHSCRVKNKFYINPGNLRVREAESEGLDTSMVHLPAFFTCPVTACKGHICKGIQDLRLHWQHNHLSVSQYFRCKECDFQTQDQQDLLEHFQCSSHRFSNQAAVSAVRTAPTWEKKNGLYIDPGRHQLVWRKMLASLKKQ